MSAICCFGEIMLRLSPPAGERLVRARGFDAVYGGAEANVAAALAGFGCPAAVVTKLPAGELGSACVSVLGSLGVDCSRIVRGGERMGLYFLEKGASLRPSKVIYDRRNSAFACSTREDWDWEAILGGASGFFFTGITPAVSDPAILEDALAVCRREGIPVSCDLNYRPTLWSPEKAGPVMRALVDGVDLLVANEEHAALLLGVTAEGEGADRHESLCRALAERYRANRVAMTFRESLSADDNIVSACLFDCGTFVSSKPYRVTGIVDRVGGGDAFTAGLLWGFRCGWDPQRTVDFAVAANALKHSIPGDMLIATAEEVERLASSDGTVRMIR